MRKSIFISSLLSVMIAAGAVVQTAVYPVGAVAGTETETDMSFLTLSETENDADAAEDDAALSFIWDRSDENGITLSVSENVRIAVLKEGYHLMAASVINSDFSVADGTAVIGADILNRLSDGVHELSLVSLNETVSFELTVTDTQGIGQQKPDFALTADISYITWDKGVPQNITIHTNSQSGTFSLYEEKELLSGSLLQNNLTVENGTITLNSELFSRLPVGEHTLSLHLEDGILPLHLTITSHVSSSAEPENDPSSEASTSETETSSPLITGTLEFVWDRSSEDGITLSTVTLSKNFSLYNGYHLLGNSLFHRDDMKISDGILTIGADILRQLAVGTHTLTLSLKEGKVTITVTITDEQGEAGEESFLLTADETDFTWDKAQLLGITVKTNSRSHSVALLKDGQMLADKNNLNAYILLGRVGITAKILRELDEGDNELTLQTEDGSLPIHVYVTDKKHHQITADQTAFTWDRNSKKDISFVTDSTSDSVSVRRTGKLFSTAHADDITLRNGVVTLKAAYLATLYDGQNKLKLTFEDGTLTVTVKVTGTGTGAGTTTVTPGQNSASHSSYSFDPNHSNSISDLPRTGDVTPAAVTAAVLLSAAVVALLSIRKKRRSR